MKKIFKGGYCHYLQFFWCNVFLLDFRRVDDVEGFL